jgi:putative autoinducer-2 (AI-2) aldolase
MGRNIFQSDSPQGMMRAIQAVVHENAKPKEAFGIYEQIKSEEQKGR